MEAALDSVPQDMEALRAAFLALRSKAAGLEIENTRLAAENTFLDTLNQKLAHHLAKLKRLSFGPSSERLDPDQLALALEDIEQKIGEVQAEAEKAAPEEVKLRRARDRRNGRPSLPDALPEVHVTIEPDLSACPQLVRARCTGSAKTPRAAWTSYRSSTASWSRIDPSTPAARARARSCRRRRPSG